MSDEYRMSEPLTNHNTIFSKYPKSQFNGFYCDEEMSYEVYVWIKEMEQEFTDFKKQITALKEREKKLLEVVKFYANISHWEHRAYSPNEVERNCFNVYEDFQSFNNVGGENPVIKIKGKRAREVLKELGIEL